MAKLTRSILVAGGAAVALAGCMTAGAQVPSASAPITQKEAQMGAQYHPQFLAEFGGAMSGPQAAYVEQIGKNVAVQSGLGNAREAFTVTLLNSPINNAFAVPGGYIYSTRQLVTLMNNEAELAGVLGHEVGHVAARHSQRREKAAQKNSILGILGAIGSSILLGDSQIGQTLSQGFLQGSQLLTLKFSRKQELEADDLGIQYLGRAGYDKRAMATVLASLAAQNSLDARLSGQGNASVPAWASTMSAVVLLAGVQLLILGVMGEYLGRMFLSANQKPQYVVREVLRAEGASQAADAPEASRAAPNLTAVR